MTIQQLLPQGITESAVINQRGKHPAGLCSEQYGKLIPCYQIGYSAHGSTAQFITLITVGQQGPDNTSVSVSRSGEQSVYDQGQPAHHS